MKYYQTVNADGLIQLAPTQEAAKSIDRNFRAVDIPIDKESLMHLINDFHRQLHEAGVNEITPEAAPTPPPAPPQAKIDLLTRQQIEDRWTSFPLSWRLDLHHVDLEEARLLAPRSLTQ